LAVAPRSAKLGLDRGEGMGTSVRTITIEARVRPEVAFACLTDPAGFGAWLPRSPVYRGTHVSTTAADGYEYVDHTPLGEVTGRLVSATPPERVEFFQATSNRALSIRIVYTLTPTAAGTSIARTGTITTAGLLRWLHPIVVAATVRENRRTMEHLRTALDEPTG
jgi:uncharacterized protein YndB with AHSA1/START domain